MNINPTHAVNEQFEHVKQHARDRKERHGGTGWFQPYVEDKILDRKTFTDHVTNLLRKICNSRSGR